MQLNEDRSALAGDPRFFQRTGPHTLAAVVDAALVDGQGADAAPRRLMLRAIASLAAATDQDVSFCLNSRKHLKALEATHAAAVIVHPDMRDKVPESTASKRSTRSPARRNSRSVDSKGNCAPTVLESRRTAPELNATVRRCCGPYVS